MPRFVLPLSRVCLRLLPYLCLHSFVSLFLWIVSGSSCPSAYLSLSNSNMTVNHVQIMMKRALDRRYRLLPYLYTLFFSASLSGVPVARSLIMEFASQLLDVGMSLKQKRRVLEELSSHSQFMLGPGTWDVGACSSFQRLYHSYGTAVDTILQVFLTFPLTPYGLGVCSKIRERKWRNKWHRQK